MTTMRLLFAAPLALAIAACSQEPAPADPVDADVADAPAAATPPSPADNSSPASKPVLALEGFGDLAIGEPVPAGSDFAMTGAQASDTCLVYTSPTYPGVYAIVEDGNVRRVTVGRDSDIELVEGIGVGATEKEVLAAFPGFVSSPHEYVAPPAKYLQQPGNDPRLRFEIGEDGRVTDMHVGVRPQLEYVEGCA